MNENANEVAAEAARPAAGQLLGMTLCAEQGLDPQETFQRQFLLARGSVTVPPGWQARAFGGWTLHHCPKLDCCPLTDSGGAAAGLILGVALEADGTVLRTGATLPAGGLQAAERWIERLSGRFVVLLQLEGHARFYVDPSCGLVSFLDPQARRVSSCIPLMLERPLRDTPALPLPTFLSEPGHYYLFGDTCDADVRRMPANHYLDLGDFTQHRHYPRDDLDPETDRANSDLLDEIAALLEAQMNGLIGTFRCALPLTGGADSRILLAHAKGRLDDIAHYFTHVTNRATMMDSVVAVSLAEALCLPMRILNTETPVVKDRLDADHCAALERMIAIRSSYQYAPSQAEIRATELAPDAELLLRGGLVEMLRANKWSPNAKQMTPEYGLRSLCRPRDMAPDTFQASLPRYAAWLDSLPEAARERAIDYAHVELWLPSTGNMAYAGLQKQMLINPFNSRRLVHLTAALPPRFRRLHRPAQYLLRKRAPELAGLPYANSYLRKALRGAGTPQEVLRAMGRTI